MKCSQCGKEFKPKSVIHRFCSVKCQKKSLAGFRDDKLEKEAKEVALKNKFLLKPLAQFSETTKL